MARLLAMGDMHGCATAVQRLVALVGLQPEDTLVTLGDYTGKGPESRQVLDWLIHQQKRCRLVPLCGNHDLLMLHARKSRKAYRRWLNAGGGETLASYGKKGRKGPTIDDVPRKHWRFLEQSLLPIFITEHYIFVHANIAPKVSLKTQPAHMLFWKKLRAPVRHYSGKVMICGHTSQKSGLPNVYGQAICIDTKVFHKNGWLSCLDLEAKLLYQANQQGQTRVMFLHPQWNLPQVLVSPRLAACRISQDSETVSPLPGLNTYLRSH